MTRVWDQFLSDQDRAYDQAHPTFAQKRSLGSRPALLMIDVYRCAFGNAPAPLLEAVEVDELSCGYAAWTALPHLQGLLAGAREAQLPVFHVTKQVDVPAWEQLDGAGLAAWHGPSPTEAQRYEFMDEVAPRPGEIVLRKASTSVFTGTPLTSMLTEMQIDTLVIAGESTSGCVRAAVVDARNQRYSVLVPEECVFDRTEASHAVSLYDMHRKYAHVTGLDDALAFMNKHGHSRV
jgi:maleamate amidohydrolase